MVTTKQHGHVMNLQTAIREIQATILTRSGWIQGVFHVPQMHGFIEYLTRNESFLKLTNVRLPRQSSIIPFFMLRQDEIILIIPVCEESQLLLPKPIGTHKNVSVSLLMFLGNIRGTLNLETQPRVSDYLVKAHSWIVLRECLIQLTNAAEENQARLIIISLHGVMGASESD